MQKELSRNPLKSFSRAWMLFFVAAIATGCGAAPAPASAPTPAAPAATIAPTNVSAPTVAPTPSPTQAKLTYAFPDDAASSAAATELIKVYTSTHPEIQISAKPLPTADYPQQLLTSIDAGAPDLFVSADAQAPALIKRNAMLDLWPLLSTRSKLKPDDFRPVALSAWQRGSALYSLPADVMPQVLFYNQDLFEANHVAAPAPGWNWDDWLAKAKQLTLRSGDQITRYGTALTQWSAMVWGNGGELLNADGTQTLLSSSEAVAGVQFAADMVNRYKVAPAPKDAGGPDPVALFQAGKVAMLPGSSSLAGSLLAAKLPFKWAIAPLPAGVVPVSPISITGVAVSPQSQNPQAALDFAAWMVGPAGSALKADLMPFSAPALLSAAAPSSQVSGAEAILQALQHGRTLPQVEAWPEIKALVDQALRPVWQGKQTAAAAYKKVEPEINSLLRAG